MRAGLVAMLLPLVGCGGETREIIVELDADEAVIRFVERAHVNIAVFAGETKVDGLELDLTGAAPTCLPLSLGVAPLSGNEDAPLTIAVDIDRVHREIHTRFAPGTRHLLVTLPRECFESNQQCSLEETRDELPAVDREQLAQRIASTACRQRGADDDPLDCVARGGCFGRDPASRTCVVPCPEPAPPEEPMPPAPPMPAQVPAEPWPNAAFIDCPVGQAHFVGEPACAAIGAPCPTGQFRSDVPMGATVDPAGGAMFTTIAAALASGAQVIVLSKGTHDAPPAIDRDVELFGACAAETTVRALTFGAVRAAVNDLQLGRLDVDSGIVSLRGVELRGAGARFRNGSTVEARELVARETTAIALELSMSTLTATRVVIDRATIAAASGGLASEVSIREGALMRTRPGGDGFAYGLTVREGSSGRLARTIVEDSSGYGVEARDTSTELHLEDTIVRTVGPDEDGEFGAGVRVAASNASFTRVLIERVRHSGVYANAGATVRAQDLTIRGVDSERSGGNGTGLTCTSGCTLQAERVQIERARRSAVLVGEGTRVAVADLTVPADPQRGRAIYVVTGGTLVLARAMLEHHIRVETSTRAAASLTIEDLTMRDTPAVGLQIGEDGANLDAHRPVILNLARAVFERNMTTGLGLARTEATIRDVVITDTRVPANAFLAGPAIVVTLAATLDATRVVLLRNREAAIYAGLIGGSSELPARAVLRELRIEGTQCMREACDGFFRGAGVGSAQLAEIEISNFAIRNNRTAGINQFYHGELDLYGGVIENEATGVILGDVDFDPARVLHGVLYRNNGADIFILPQ